MVCAQKNKDPNYQPCLDNYKREILEEYLEEGPKDDTHPEVSLFAARDGGHDRGRDCNNKRCTYCGIKGHLQRECQKYRREKNQLHCLHCNIDGHDYNSFFKVPGQEHLKDKYGI